MVAGSSLRFILLGVISLVCFSMPALASGASGNGQLIQSTWIKGFKDMTAQLYAASAYMYGTIGGFIDGANANQYQLVMKQLEAEAISAYTPGENLCRLGTLTRALAGSEERAFTTAAALRTMMLNRETHNNSRTRPYADADNMARLHNLATLYCNPGDNDRAPAVCNCDLKNGTCDANKGPLDQRSNRDLDLVRLFDQRLTMKINFIDDKLTPDEQDTLGLLDHLSAFRPLPPVSPEQMQLTTSPTVAKIFMEGRSLAASRGVIRSSLATQFGRRAEGTESSMTFMLNALEELGMTKEEAKRYLRAEGLGLNRGGSDANEIVYPSYEAQMEVLTKKLYQNPNFYVNLIDKPANVERIRASLLAIASMQRRDMKETLDRRELLLSQLLEFDLRNAEDMAAKRVAHAASDPN